MIPSTGRHVRSALILLVLLTLLLAGCGVDYYPWEGEKPQNLILFIGDGMGWAHLQAAAQYDSGDEFPIFFNQFPTETSISTGNAYGLVTDSAAAATAMATGRKVANGVISVKRPGLGGNLQTILELAKADGMATGLVTTTYLTHATPAAFAAHEFSRSSYDAIASDYLTGSQPDVLFGGGGNGLTVAATQAAGYEVVTTAADLATLAGGPAPTTPVAALIGDGHLPYIADGRGADVPSLVDMTTAAVDILSADPDGFFLMVEAGRIDHASHSNNLARMIPEVLELRDAVDAVVLDTDLMLSTAVVITADHETGDLWVDPESLPGELPAVEWGSTGHTGGPVPLFATGPGAEAFWGVGDNAEVFFGMADLLGL